MREIVKKKLPKGAIQTVKSLQTVRSKCLTVNTAAVHIPIKVLNKVRGSWFYIQMRKIKKKTQTSV